MSQQEAFEACFTKHNQACQSLHKKFSEAYKSTCRATSRLCLDIMHHRDKKELTERANEAISTILSHLTDMHETETALCDITRQPLQDQQREVTALQEKHEAELRDKDEEIKALKESVNDLRENRRDKDDMIAMTKEMNNFLVGQLQEQKDLYKAKEENMRLLMAEQKKQAETRLEATPKRKLPAHARFP
ncbi:uncharacterized protein FTJAE_7885 [Fusarium tjaetaba]|uniref:Uncharacterized protein n=1 Tax=Fusarium tjaetaba TaxID=1567544 RepID=A0A8H5RE14_9HYPO|nr:uncharacterized protein FTJAE_7885 [Fusarium tjaetaba]KAF5631482.1 hypothetical protein FTJAE_7885 [Fusarium tjaetaba]